MQIKKIHVSGFKSLVDFDMDLSKFTCLIGLNGSGKSTVLQFIDFISRLMTGDMEGWLAERRWGRFDLNFALGDGVAFSFEIELRDADGNKAIWKAIYDIANMYCMEEHISTRGAVLEVKDKSLEYSEAGKRVFEERIRIGYSGSALARLDEVAPSLIAIKDFLKGIHSLGLLSPDSIRSASSGSEGSIGSGGDSLFAYLNEIDDQKRIRITDRLKEAYPQFEDVILTKLPSGAIALKVIEAFGEIALATKAAHVNDGMLRLLAILAELEDERPFILYDEIENGINSELVEFVLTALIESNKQVMVTTHSPMILNYLEDDVAREGVMYLYKTRNGATKAIPFFSIPSLAKKLEVMGPGEAFVDTNLVELADEIKSFQGDA